MEPGRRIELLIYGLRVRNDGFLGADTVVGLGVGSGLGAGAARPACDVGGAHGRGVILTSPADQSVE